MKVLKFLFSYAQNYRIYLIITVISMIALVGVDLLGPQIIKQLVATVEESVAGEINTDTITQLALFALGIYVGRAVLQFLRSYMAHIAGWGVVADARRHLYEHLQRLSLRFYEDKQTGNLMSRVVNDSDLFERLIAHAIPDVVTNVLMLIGVSLVLLNMNVQLMLLTLIPVPLIVIGMRGFAKFVRPAFRQRQEELGELNARLNDNLSGIREIKAFTREDIEADRIGDRIIHYRDSLVHALKLMAVFHPFVGLAASLGTIIVIFFGGRLALEGALNVSELVAFFLYLGLFYQPIRALTNTWEGIQEAMAGAERAEELLQEEPDVQEKPDAVAIEGRAKGALKLQDVRFHYIEGKPVLTDINLDIPENSIVALVGPTGVGKTTLAGLIPRFYDVVSGKITLDGHDIRDLQLESLRSQISMVLQDVFLFHGTARENILFGNPEASEAEMIEAAEIANAHDFISELPEGYDTIIGERGVKLSGGQKQRLAIARAVLKDAPILILDEATSSVDTQTELLIQQALERLMVGRTTIIIAHRLSTIRNADMIVVLKDDRIAEKGTHEELMAGDGLYRHLNEVQRRVEPDFDAMPQQIAVSTD